MSAPHRQIRSSGFSMLELLVAMTVLIIIGVLLTSMTQMTAVTWRRTTERMESFQAAQIAFERISSNLSQATLNSYWDYDDPLNPKEYQRTSELQFLSLPTRRLAAATRASYFPAHALMFQAPIGTVADRGKYGNLSQLLNALGYFIEYGDDSAERPSFLPASVTPQYRYRLKEWRVPSDEFLLYAQTTGANGKDWLGAQTLSWIDLNAFPCRVLAENVVAFVVIPINTEAPTASASLLVGADFSYNSRNDGTSSVERWQRHQLPPEVELVMVAVDESSANRVFGHSPTSPGLGSGLFEDPQMLDQDITALTDELTERGLRYVILRSRVKIRGARWSSN